MDGLTKSAVGPFDELEAILYIEGGHEVTGDEDPRQALAKVRRLEVIDGVTKAVAVHPGGKAGEITIEGKDNIGLIEQLRLEDEDVVTFGVPVFVVGDEDFSSLPSLDWQNEISAFVDKGAQLGKIETKQFQKRKPRSFRHGSDLFQVSIGLLLGFVEESTFEGALQDPVALEDNLKVVVPIFHPPRDFLGPTFSQLVGNFDGSPFKG